MGHLIALPIAVYFFGMPNSLVGSVGDEFLLQAFQRGVGHLGSSPAYVWIGSFALLPSRIRHLHAQTDRARHGPPRNESAAGRRFVIFQLADVPNLAVRATHPEGAARARNLRRQPPAKT